jgi:hypothetical protein
VRLLTAAAATAAAVYTAPSLHVATAAIGAVCLALGLHIVRSLRRTEVTR